MAKSAPLSSVRSVQSNVYTGEQMTKKFSYR